jgi:O-methyltransferase involved in polyketide biosynthesis
LCDLSRAARIIDVSHLSPLEQTALLTQYARAPDSRRPQPILGDTRADEIVTKPATSPEPATARVGPTAPEAPIPEPSTAEGKQLRVNPIACSAHGRRAKRAVTDCPALALRLADPEPLD